MQNLWRRRFGWIAIICFIVAWPAFFGIGSLDHSIANVAFALFNLLALLFGCLWIAFLASVPIQLRICLLSIPAVGLAAFIWMLEFRGFSGEMVPQFRRRGEANPTQWMAADVAGRSELVTPDRLSDFRQFLGNNRNGFVSDITLSERWGADLPRILWKQPIGPGWSGFAIQDDLAITMEEFEGSDSLVALNAGNGNLRWRTPVERRHFHPAGGAGPRATPTIDGDRVFSQSSTGIVFCCELESGKVVWKVDLLEKAGVTQKEAELAVSWGRSGSPLLYRELVILPLGGALERSPAGLIALDRATGAEKWRGGHDQISYASASIMSIQGVEQVVVVNESTASGHDPETGDVLWSCDWPGESNGGASVSQAVLIDSSHVLLSKGYGGGARMLNFTASSPPIFVVSTQWKNASLLKTKFTNVVYRDGYLYGLSDGILECVRAVDGKRMWKDARNGRLGHGQLLVVGKHLLISSEDGRCVFGRADPSSFQKIGEISVLSGISWNTIAIAGNRVLMRNGEQAACLEVPIDEVQ